MEVTAEAARQVLAGNISLRSLLNVPREELARMAAYGHELWRQGRKQEAKKMFQVLIDTDETLYYGHAGMGLATMGEEDFAAARTYLVRALELEPGDPAVAVNLGEVLLRLGQLPEALAALQKAVELDPSLSNAGSARAAAILTGMGHGLGALNKKELSRLAPAGTK